MQKKAEEDKYMKQLEEARKQAFLDRQLVGQKVTQRLLEKDPRLLEREEENLNKRRVLEE